jgi:hypothetical protein
MAARPSTRRGEVTLVKRSFPTSRPVPARLAIVRVNTRPHRKASWNDFHRESD